MITLLLMAWMTAGAFAWVYLMIVVNRRYYTPVSFGLILFLLAFMLLGPLAWFVACVIKGIHESE